MLTLYNTRLKRTSLVEPINAGVVKMYTCGPTVYRDAHIGNLRSYLMADWIRRVLETHGLSVTQVKNITDVGHMRQEALERGDDKVLAAANASGKSPAEIAQTYTKRFNLDESKLNITPAEYNPKATDHVLEMIEIICDLLTRGYAYEVQGNIYFNVSTYPHYGNLSGNKNNQSLLQAVRIDADPLKKDPRDFTLWKRAEPGRKLKWDSPWGHGFPGWHIECSAMSIKYLGKQFDIHTGAVDNIFPHHEDEIAQTECFTGLRTVNLWVHGQHLLSDGVKMAKSSGNSFTLADIEAQNIDPLAFRYLCLTVRFNTKLNFTFTSLKGAQRALLKLRHRIWEWSTLPQQGQIDKQVIKEWKNRFMERVDDNLDMPGALSITWQLARSNLPVQMKLNLIKNYDRILGLSINTAPETSAIPGNIIKKISKRNLERSRQRYEKADALRNDVEQNGYGIEDSLSGTRIRLKSPWENRKEAWPSISSSSEVKSLLLEPNKVELSILIVANNYLEDLRRCVKSVLKWTKEHSVEIIIVNNGSTNDIGSWIEQAAVKDCTIRTIHSDHMLGEAMAKNVLLQQSLGRIIIMLETSVEVFGDIFVPIQKLLSNKTVGVTGPFGLRTSNLHHFHEGEGTAGDMDAMQAYCFAFKRKLLADVGLMRESFRFYRNLDLDYSFHFKNKGYRIVADPTLPLHRHKHRIWTSLSNTERDELSRKNYRRFLDKWGHRTDLLVAPEVERSV